MYYKMNDDSTESGSFEEILSIGDGLPETDNLEFPLKCTLTEIKEKSDRFKNLEMRDLTLFQHYFHKLCAGRYNNSVHTIVEDNLDKIYQDFIDATGNHVDLGFLKFLSRNFISSKSAINTYFDKIYVLNLDRRPDRMEKMEKRLKQWGITNWVRFPAIDGSQSPHWEEWKHYSKSRLTRVEKTKYNRKAIASCGSWAILKATYHLLRDAQKNKYERILILQDDDLFHKNFHEEFAKAIKVVPKDWRLFYLGATQHNWSHIIKAKHYYHPNGTADGAFAVGVHSKIYEEFIKEILKFDMPVDSGALKTLQKRYVYQSYVMSPNLIIADIRDSDLRQARDLNIFGKKLRWDANLYDIN